MKKSFLQKRKIFTFVLGILFTASTAFIPTVSFGITQADYYVDPANGNDANSGTSFTSPFKTIDKARTVVRTINNSMTGDIYVFLRGSNYILSSTITFTELDGGSNGYKVIYKAFNNELPLISGDKTITGWMLQDVTKNIYKASTGYTTDIRQLFVNRNRAIRARSVDTLPYTTLVNVTNNVGVGYVSPKTNTLGWDNIIN